MRKESTHKCSEAVLHLVVYGSLMVLIATGLLLVLSQPKIALVFQPFWPVFVLGVAVAAFGLRTIARAGVSISEDALSVCRPFGMDRIDYRSITRVERVCRKGSTSAEKVRLTFRQLGLEKSVEITPADPALLVCDVLSKCPHITGSKSSRLKRNRSFREAKETLKRRTRRMPPVDY